MGMRILHLHVKKKYFDQIKSGKKKIEYRRDTPYWKKRLVFDREYNLIMVYCGYPRKGDSSRTLLFRYGGYYHAHGLVHEEFGDKPVAVFCIPLRNDA
jgi:hypothetical protein